MIKYKNFKSVLIVNPILVPIINYQKLFEFRISLSWMNNLNKLHLISNNNEIDILIIGIDSKEINDCIKILNISNRFLLIIFIVKGDINNDNYPGCYSNVIYWPSTASISFLQLLIRSKFIQNQNKNENLHYLATHRRLIVRGSMIKLSLWEEAFYNILKDTGNEKYLPINKIQNIFKEKTCREYKSKTLVTYISRMRKKIKINSNMDIIKVEYRKGYSLK